MIQQFLYYPTEDALHSWTVDLPYRLMQGDWIDSRFLDTKAKSFGDPFHLEVDLVMFQIDYIEIDSHAQITAWLKLE